MTRVVVADDHPIVRTGIVALLSEQPDFDVVGQCGDGLSTVQLVAELRPDVLVLDLMLPALSGFEVARRVARGGTRVLVLSFHGNEAYAAEVLANGADAFVSKDAHPNEILRVLRRVAAGERHVPPRLAEAGPSGRARDPWSRLTDREREVVHLVGEGANHADVGLRLGISGRTVEVHRSNAMRKLGLESTTELVRFLIRRGLLGLDDDATG